jgi:O-antigen/teichoic acid export membrane protein
MEKSFLKKISEGIIWSSSGSIILKGLWFLGALAIVAKLSLHQFGTYQIVLAAWSLILTFLLVKSDQIFIARGSTLFKEDNPKEAVSLGLSLFLVKFSMSIIVWLVLFYGSSIFVRWYSGDVIQHLKVLSFALFVVPFDNLINYDLSIRKNFFLLNLFGVTEEIIKVLGIFISLFLLNMGVEGLIWVIIIALYAKVILLGSRLFSYVKCLSFISLKPFFEIFFSIGKWNILQSYIEQIRKNSVVFFIQYFIGREGVALFALANKLFSHIASLFPVKGFLIPLISSELHNRGRLQSVLERGVKYSVFLFGLIAIFSAIVMPFFLSAFFPKYLPSMPLFYIMLLLLPFMGAYDILLSFLVSNQEQKTLFLLSLFRIFIMAIALPVLLLTLGIIGSAIEYTFFAFIMFYLRYTTLTHLHPELKIRFSQLIIFDNYDRELLRKIKARIWNFRTVV